MWKKFKEGLPFLIITIIVWAGFRLLNGNALSTEQHVYSFIMYILVVAGLSHTWDFIKYVFTRKEK